MNTINEHQFKNIISLIFVVFALIVLNIQFKSNDVYYPSIQEKETQVSFIAPLVSVEPRVLTNLQTGNAKNISRFEDLDMPQGINNPKYFEKLFDQVSKITGVDKKILFKFAAIESSFDPSKVSKIGASGLFQFTPATWKFNIRHFGKQYGITEKDILDPRANALLQGFHVQSIIKLIEDKTDIQYVKTQDIYMAHLLGRTGFLKFHKMQSKTIVANRMPLAAKFNRPFFYQGNKALNQSEVKLVIQNHIASKVKEFGLLA